MRPELETVVAALLARSEDHRTVTLDEVGDALGTEVASADDVDAILLALEAAGRSIVSTPGGDPKERLRSVLGAARDLQARTGRRPTPVEIAQETGLDESAVRAALMFGRVMGR
jgi:hypothetical protein